MVVFKKLNKATKKKILLIPAVALLLILIAFTAYNLYFLGKIFPGIYIAGVYVGGKTPSQAIELVTKNIQVPTGLTLIYQNQNFEISDEEIGVSYDFIDSVMAAYELPRTGNILFDFWQRIKLPLSGKNMGLRVSFDEERLGKSLSIIDGQVSTEPVYPSLKLVKKEVIVNKGKAGAELDLALARIKIGENLAFAKDEPIDIPLKTIDPSIAQAQAQQYAKRAEILIDKTLNLKFEYQTYSFKNNDIFALLDPKDSYSDKGIGDLIIKLTSEINRPPQEPVFIFQEGRVREFEPSKDGVAVREDSLREIITEGLKNLESSGQTAILVEIPVTRTPSKITTGDINNLGVRELIGRGTSKFVGSIPNRVHNIVLSASKFKGVLVAPGETFSFNDILGDVSGLTGFKQAYIIKEGKTVLGDGGGVCQVSSTFFRAALNAGLPIMERAAHAYRVGYYEQDSPPGFDATVYSPHPDLKIKNDTPGHILIQSNVDIKKSTLAFEIYGTLDGRVASTSKPVVSDQVAPPEDLYVDDPTLPAGTVKQIDYKAWGAKVTFNYLVQRGGETVYKKMFVSNYRPWQAVFLRGVGPAN